ncbi:6734_t:CDS:1, partial [Cetraspora pellucida]
PERIQTSFESGHFHSHSNMPQHEQSYSSSRQLRNAIQVLMATPTHPHSMVSRPMHHPYQHPVYRQNDRVDPATELLAEKSAGGEHNDGDAEGARLDTGGKIGMILSVSIVKIGGKTLSEPEE